MRKVLFWMCVLLLPVVGLFGAMWLVPAAKPLWHRSLASPCKVLGMVEDGRTLLVVQTNKSGELLVIGLDTANGKERFTQVLTYQKLQARPSAGDGNNYLPEPVLSDDGKLIALPAAIDTNYDHVIVLYDWQTEKVVQRIELPTGRSVYHLSLNQGRLLGLGVGRLVDWKMNEPISSIDFKMLNTKIHRLEGISRDGNIVYGVSSVPEGAPTTTALRFYNIAEQRALPDIPGLMYKRKVLDIPTSETVLVLDILPVLPFSHTVQTYRLQGDEYVHVAELDYPLKANGFAILEKDYVAISELRRFNHSRQRAIEWLGLTIATYFDWVWPQHNVHIYDRKTMKYLLTHSADNLSTRSTPQHFLLVPEHSALVLTYQEFMDYWQINPITRYLPLLGLLTGSLLSLLLVIRRYRRARKLSAAIPVC
jgi:hypothetical protein